MKKGVPLRMIEQVLLRYTVHYTVLKRGSGSTFSAKSGTTGYGVTAKPH